MNMGNEWLTRTELLLGGKDLKKLSDANVLVVGLGGVGAYAAEFICRAGVGRMTVIDGDNVETSNRNRQLLALKSTETQSKALLMSNRLKDINPNAEITPIHEFIRDDRMKEILSFHYDYVVDAIDSLSPKVYLIKISLDNGLKVVSSMGAGGKMDPSKVQVSDIDDSYKCKLARTVRKRLHRLGITTGFKVVFSPEDVPDEAVLAIEGEEIKNKNSIVGTISYMPAIFGIYCASTVINDLTKV